MPLARWWIEDVASLVVRRVDYSAVLILVSLDNTLYLYHMLLGAASFALHATRVCGMREARCVKTNPELYL